MWDLYLIWFVVGMVLITIEAITPGVFVFLFFGIGALSNALITYFVPDVSYVIQSIVFLAVSIGSMLLFRKQIRNHFFKKDTQEEDPLKEDFVGKRAVAQENFVAQEGTVTFNGTLWKAKTTTEDIKKGDILIITALDNLTLVVEPINS